MNFDDYKHPWEYSERPKRPHLNAKATAQEAREYADLLEEYEKLEKDYDEHMAKWREFDLHLIQMFREDAIDEAGLKGCPIADRIYSLAWEQGHSAGLSEVWAHLEDLVDSVFHDWEKWGELEWTTK